MIYSIIEIKPYVAGLFHFFHQNIFCCYVIHPATRKIPLLIKFSEATETIDYFRFELKIYRPHYKEEKLFSYEKIKEYKLNFMTRTDFSDLAISEINNALKTKGKPEIFEIDENRLAFITKSFEYFTYMSESEIIRQIYVSEKVFNALASNNKTIDISSEKLKEFPVPLLMKKKTEKIDIRENSFEYLPDEFADFQQLKYLDISNNLFFELPEVIMQIKSLEHLIIRNLLIDEIPNTIKALTNLEELEINLYHLTNLPKGISELKKIKKLVLEETNIYEIPKFISELESLEELHIINNPILKILPEEISNLENLILLYLYGNQISSLPNSIGKLKKLKVLDLEHNKLKKLPPTISELNSLEKLNVAKNKLTEFDFNILELPNLKCIVIEGNPKIDKKKIQEELIKRKKENKIKII